MKRTPSSNRAVVRVLAPVTIAALALAACGSDDASSTSSSALVAPKIVVTSVQDDPESQLFAAIYARVLEEAGYRVSRKDPVALDREGYYAALQSGEFQLIPDTTLDLLRFLYSLPDAPTAPTTVAPEGPATTQAPITIPPTTTIGTGSTTTAAATTSTTSAATTTTEAVKVSNGRTVTEQLVAIRSALAESVAVGNPTVGEQKQVIACTPAVMKANEGTQFVSLTNLASVAPTIRLGGSQAWQDDEELGLPALEQYYAGEYEEIVTVEEADIAAAVEDDTADCFAVDSMNPVITTEKLTILQDDKAMVPGNAWVPLMSSTFANEDVIAALDSVSSALTSARVNQMMNQIINEGTDPVVVADAFLNAISSGV